MKMHGLRMMNQWKNPGGRCHGRAGNRDMRGKSAIAYLIPQGNVEERLAMIQIQPSQGAFFLNYLQGSA